MATTTLRIPKAAVSMQEGTLSEWLVPDGTRVEEGQPIYSLEIEKSIMDVEAPVAGILKHGAQAGSALPPGHEIGEIISD
ncbi:MAG: lipoyl domain-containing protein [Chromatiales bacterium]|nr:MAG: lipoyl domain-containing protein [Chromatiales bacterium]